MTTVTTNTGAVTETVQNGNNVSVPSGEIWDVRVTRSTGGGGPRISFNGTEIFNFTAGSGEVNPINVRAVLEAGTTISVKGGNSSDYVLVSGHEMSGQVDNSVVTTVLSNSSTTVSSGNRWESNLLAGTLGGPSVEVNDNEILTNTSNNTDHSKRHYRMTLGDGDKIAETNGGNILLTAYVL